MSFTVVPSRGPLRTVIVRRRALSCVLCSSQSENAPQGHASCEYIRWRLETVLRVWPCTERAPMRSEAAITCESFWPRIFTEGDWLVRTMVSSPWRET